MSLGYFFFTLFVVCAFISSTVHSRSYNTGLIFYDLRSQRAFLPPTVSVSRGRSLNSVKYSDKGSIWSTFGKPCECQGPLCGCCAGLKVNQFNFDQKMCANVTYSPKKERIFMEVFLNQQPASKYGISARNPSPLCIPVMMPIPMAMCVQMSDIAIQGNNLNMCMDFVVRLASTELFEMHFQCMKMGMDGIQYVDKNGKPVIPEGSVKINDNENEYYDETPSDAETGDEHDNEQSDDNIMDNVIEIDDYDTKTYVDEMDNQKTDDTIKEESSAENEDGDVAEEVEEDNAKEEEDVAYDENENNIGTEESQTEALEIPQPMANSDNESNFTPIEEEDVMTTTSINAAAAADDSATSPNEFITTTQVVKDFESTTEAFTTERDIITDIPTQNINNVTSNLSATEDPEVKNLKVSNKTSEASHEYLHAEKMPAAVTTNLTMAASTTAIDPSLVSKEVPRKLNALAKLSTVTLKPKASRMLAAKKLRKAKAKPKRKERENPITMFRRLFDFF